MRTKLMLASGVCLAVLAVGVLAISLMRWPEPPRILVRGSADAREVMGATQVALQRLRDHDTELHALFDHFRLLEASAMMAVKEGGERFAKYSASHDALEREIAALAETQDAGLKAIKAVGAFSADHYEDVPMDQRPWYNRINTRSLLLTAVVLGAFAAFLIVMGWTSVRRTSA